MKHLLFAITLATAFIHAQDTGTKTGLEWDKTPSYQVQDPNIVTTEYQIAEKQYNALLEQYKYLTKPKMTLTPLQNLEWKIRICEKRVEMATNSNKDADTKTYKETLYMLKKRWDEMKNPPVTDPPIIHLRKNNG